MRNARPCLPQLGFRIRERKLSLSLSVSQITLAFTSRRPIVNTRTPPAFLESRHSSHGCALYIARARARINFAVAIDRSANDSRDDKTERQRVRRRSTRGRIRKGWRRETRSGSCWSIEAAVRQYFAKIQPVPGGLLPPLNKARNAANDK